MCSKLKGTAHQAELAQEEILRLRGAITQLEQQFALPHVHKLTTAAADSSPGLDSGGTVPWHPNGAPFERTVLQARVHEDCEWRLLADLLPPDCLVRSIKATTCCVG